MYCRHAIVPCPLEFSNRAAIKYNCHRMCKLYKMIISLKISSLKLDRIMNYCNTLDHLCISPFYYQKRTKIYNAYKVPKLMLK